MSTTHKTAVDALELRRAFGHFATGVTVVTYAFGAGGAVSAGEDGAGDGVEFRGTTVNSFTSVSLEPPLLLVCLGRQTRSAAALRPGSPFTVNVLRHGQLDLAMHFAGRPQSSPGGATPGGGSDGKANVSDPQGTRVEWELRAGVPQLAGCAAHFRCTAQDVHDAGDHVLLVGRVEEFQAVGHEHGHAPLLFYRGAFERLRDPAVAQPGAEIAGEIFIDFPELWLPDSGYRTLFSSHCLPAGETGRARVGA